MAFQQFSFITTSTFLRADGDGMACLLRTIETGIVCHHRHRVPGTILVIHPLYNTIFYLNHQILFMTSYNYQCISKLLSNRLLHFCHEPVSSVLWYSFLYLWKAHIKPFWPCQTGYIFKCVLHSLSARRHLLNSVINWLGIWRKVVISSTLNPRGWSIDARNNYHIIIYLCRLYWDY